MTNSLTMTKIETPSVAHLPALTPELASDADERHLELMRVLYNALTVKRPHGGIDEARFVTWMSKRYAATLIDGAGNLHFDMRTGPQHRTLFTSHTDTVHHKGGVNNVRVDGKFWRADGDVLGADDGAGVALIAHLMFNMVPGYYILFRGEECGGVGSSWLADNMPSLLMEFDRAVAFDRAGYYDVITHQGGKRCCSATFAGALSEALSSTDLMFMPCDGGVYTDTAEFVDLIPECTNVSVGYKSQHSSREEQDVAFLKDLADVLVSIPWDSLPTERDPRVKESLYGKSSGLSATPTWLKDWEDFKTWSTLDDPYDKWDLDDVEEDLYIALCDAQDGHGSRLLLNMVAELVSPENPNAAQLNAARLDANLIADAMDMLSQGFDAETVAGEIYATLSIY